MRKLALRILTYFCLSTALGLAATMIMNRGNEALGPGGSEQSNGLGLPGMIKPPNRQMLAELFRLLGDRMQGLPQGEDAERFVAPAIVKPIAACPPPMDGTDFLEGLPADDPPEAVRDDRPKARRNRPQPKPDPHVFQNPFAR